MNTMHEPSILYQPIKNAPTCPKCGKKMVYRSAEGVYITKTETMLFVCPSFPECNVYAKTNTKPTGEIVLLSTPADEKLRALRTEAHYYFDLLYKKKIFKDRATAYKWLAPRVSLNPFSAFKHIGEMDLYGCRKTIEESLKLLDARNISFSRYISKRTTYADTVPDLARIINRRGINKDRRNVYD